MLVFYVLSMEACGLGALEGLSGVSVQEADEGGTDSAAIATDGPEDASLADSRGQGGSGGAVVDVSPRTGGSDEEAGSYDAGDAEQDARIDVADAAGSSDAAQDATPDAPRILALTVYDTANASLWAIVPNFQLNHPGIWPDFAGAFVKEIDPGASFLLGKDWIRTPTASKDYAPEAGPHAEAQVTLSGTANVYLIVDQRATVYVNPTANGWTGTTLTLQVWESGGHTDRAFSVWARMNQTGDVLLPIQNFHGAFNYFVIVE